MPSNFIIIHLFKELYVQQLKVPVMKRMITFTIRRSGREPFGFRIVGGKDAERTCRIEKVTLFSPAHEAGLQTHDYLVTVQGQTEQAKFWRSSLKEVTILCPNFDELWGKQGQNTTNEHKTVAEQLQEGPQRGKEYFLHAMSAGLPGKKDTVFTTVGKPRAQVIQYDNPINCYSEDVINEMMEDNVSWKRSLNPEPVKKRDHVLPRIQNAPLPVNSHLSVHKEKGFNPRNSNVLAFMSEQERANLNPSKQSEIYHTPLPRYFY
ncbi:PDLIM1_2_3_4 [Lepeophtheirus salmonis]|uniref:PDLIM1_2_3_4 n=1 Tax=Lepeophtheirus salmonis TaxID=72036 RepID=A0A7R8D2P3_LEPSM|nr:PDLIM1_2_3_4 [Lepeophtheirus salmonis]CAF3007661.1 PDLIM1_2_3_4 [Lepeophtheirus salmonis]